MQPQQLKSSNPTQPPAALPHEVERARRLELLKKVKSLREGLLLNRGGLLKGEDTMEYKWVNVREERRLHFEALGWTLVRVDKDNPKVVAQVPPKDDGTIIRGDLILYQIDKEMAEALDMFSVAKGLELTENAGADFESYLARFAVPVFHPRV